MFELTNRDLVDLLNAINESGIASFHLKTADYEISVSCMGEDSAPAAAGAAQDDAGTVPSAVTQPATGTQPDATGEQSAPGALEAAPVPPPGAPASGSGASAPSENPEQDGATPILSPMVGAFYVAPEPGAPPYVEVGAMVTPDSTIGLIEAMKVFTAVTAEMHGVVTAILVGNGEFVEYGQPLALVTGADSPGSNDEGTGQA